MKDRERGEITNRYVLPLAAAKDVGLVGGKAVNLGALVRAGLPVPPGVCITTEAFDYFQQTGELPEGLIQQISQVQKSLGGKIAVRSSATIEDGDSLSMAGVFSSEYIQNGENTEEVMKRIFNQARSQEVQQYAALHGIPTQEIKMGLVVQQLIEPDHAGVVYTGVNRNKQLVQYVSGFGDSLVDGSGHGSAVLLDASGIIVQSSHFEERPLSSNATQQLSKLSQKIEALFLGKRQDIEFAEKNGKVYVLQARTLTADIGTVTLKETQDTNIERIQQQLCGIAQNEENKFGVETTIFSDSNFSELLPNPTEMDFGVFSYIFSGSDGVPGAIQLGRREMGYPLGNESVGFLYYVGGKPYMSIAGDSATFYEGYPDSMREYFSTLTNRYLSEIQSDVAKGHYPEMGLYLQDPTIEDLVQLYGQRNGRRYFERYQGFLSAMGHQAKFFQEDFYRGGLLAQLQKEIRQQDTFPFEKTSKVQITGQILSVLEHLRTVSCVYFVEAARLGFYYSQKLQHILQEIPGIDAEKVFALLSQGLDGSEITDVNRRIASASSDRDAYSLARELVGHYSTGEMLEIRHPRLEDSPEALKQYVDAIRSSAQSLADFERQKKERLQTEEEILARIDPGRREYITHVIHSAQTYMALRETVKYYFVKEYATVRKGLDILQQRLGLSEGDIYYLYPRELSQFIANPQSFRHLIQARKQHYALNQELSLPSVIRKEDIPALGRQTGMENKREFEGRFLANGERVKGVIVNIDHYTNITDVQAELDRYKRQGTPVILVARQLNLSHDPLIAQAAGIIIQNAGIVSHGAQRARELGKGAIGGISTAALPTGTLVDFSPEERMVRKEN